MNEVFAEQKPTPGEVRASTNPSEDIWLVFFVQGKGDYSVQTSQPFSLEVFSPRGEVLVTPVGRDDLLEPSIVEWGQLNN